MLWANGCEFEKKEEKINEKVNTLNSKTWWLLLGVVGLIGWRQELQKL